MIHFARPTSDLNFGPRFGRIELPPARLGGQTRLAEASGASEFVGVGFGRRWLGLASGRVARAASERGQLLVLRTIGP